MQLGRPTSGPGDAPDLSEALRRATAARGHRPALTVLGAGPDGQRRDEQAFASLFQWTAKGAHLLQVDADLQPGDLVHLDAPPGWLAAAVCLATWWAGGVVTDQRADAVVSVCHEASPVAAEADWILGDAVDGTPTTDGEVEPWAIAVQTFPDQPPPAMGSPDADALHVAGGLMTQAELLSKARALPSGRLGMRGGDLLDLAVLLAARPAATGDPTVLVLRADPSAEAAEGVHHWAG